MISFSLRIFSWSSSSSSASDSPSSSEIGNQISKLGLKWTVQKEQNGRISKMTILKSYRLNINQTALDESNCARFFEFTVQFTPATGQFYPRPSTLELNQSVHQTWRGIIFNISIFLLTKKTMVGYRLLIVIVCRTFIEIFFHLLLVLNRGVSVKDYIKYRLVHMTWTDIILHSLMWSIYIARCSWQ